MTSETKKQKKFLQGTTLSVHLELEDKDKFREVAYLLRTSLSDAVYSLALDGIKFRNNELEKLRAERKKVK